MLKWRYQKPSFNAMNFQQLFQRAPVTTLLMISFVALFMVQVLSGVDVNHPDSDSLIRWGANVLPYTLGHEPWRLISSAFLHIGFMHLLFNTFAMYFFGQVAEVSFGSVKFFLLFIFSAVGGNLLNTYVTWWQIFNSNGLPGISAGASGGIMGIGMALLIVELLKHTVLKLPKTGNRSQLKNLALIMGINLVYGFAVPGIDNAGHIGGALTGAIIAIFIVLGYRFSVTGSNRMLSYLPWIAYIIIAIIFYWLWLDLHQHLGI